MKIKVPLFSIDWFLVNTHCLHNHNSLQWVNFTWRWYVNNVIMNSEKWILIIEHYIDIHRGLTACSLWILAYLVKQITPFFVVLGKVIVIISNILKNWSKVGNLYNWNSALLCKWIVWNENYTSAGIWDIFMNKWVY